MIKYEKKRVTLSPDIPPQAREWRNHPDVFKWCRQYTLISQDEQATWTFQQGSDSRVKMFGINMLTGDPCGVCGFTSINHLNQSAEFSIYIAPPFQGRGFGVDALYTLVRHGFEAFNFNRIWGEVFEGNSALEAFKEVGFREEGILRQSYFREGKFINSTMISLLRQDFAPITDPKIGDFQYGELNLK